MPCQSEPRMDGARMWPGIAGLIATLLLLCVQACALQEGEAGPRGPSVVVFGDSIVAGNALPEGQRHLAWVNRVAVAMKGRAAVANEGRPGIWTDARAEFSEVLDTHPGMTVLVIALGTNDSGDLSQRSAPRAAANIREMIRMARRSNGDALPIILVAPPGMNAEALKAEPALAQARLRKLGEVEAALRALAAETGCRFVSLLGVVPPESMADDGMHPDAHGNELIAGAILPELRAALGD